jgi:hypothetical protein
MVRHAHHHHDGLDTVLRAERMLALSLLWSALAACVVASVIYDIGHWVGGW